MAAIRLDSQEDYNSDGHANMRPASLRSAMPAESGLVQHA